MRRETFEGAVEIARDIIRQQIELSGTSPSENFARFYQIRPAETRAAYLRDLLWCSEQIVVAWDSVNLIAVDLLQKGELLPTELGKWVADRLNGQRQRPTKRGRAPDADHARNRGIVDAVQWLVAQGMTATRNGIRNRHKLTNACFEGASACDAVGVAVCLGYKRIEAIWTESASPDSAIARRPFKITGYRQSPPSAIVSYSIPGNK